MSSIKLYCGINLDELKILGSGTQGKVYKIDNERCIKIFKSKRDCKEELKTLIIAQSDAHFPRLYQYGQDYIIREYIHGIELDKYLSNNNLSPHLIEKIIELYEAMLGVGYTRIDAAIFHILVTSNGELKLIDTAKAMRKETSIPSLLISGLEKLKLKEDLFIFLKNNRPDLYDNWRHYTKINYKKKC